VGLNTITILGRVILFTEDYRHVYRVLVKLDYMDNDCTHLVNDVPHVCQ